MTSGDTASELTSLVKKYDVRKIRRRVFVNRQARGKQDYDKIGSFPSAVRCQPLQFSPSLTIKKRKKKVGRFWLIVGFRQYLWLIMLVTSLAFNNSNFRPKTTILRTGFSMLKYVYGLRPDELTRCGAVADVIFRQLGLHYCRAGCLPHTRRPARTPSFITLREG